MDSPVIVEHMEKWPVARLVPYANNARTHSDAQVKQIMASIARFGFVNPILVGDDQVIIAGHGRLMAAVRLGFESVPVIVLSHLTPVQRRALALADNQLTLNASWNEQLLLSELAALKEQDFDLDCTGFSEDIIADLSALQDSPAALGDEEAMPAIRPIPVSRRGDLWLLGPHRLLCGDATVAADRDQLMENEKAALGFSDTPYNVDYKGYTEEQLTIQGDRMNAEQFRLFLVGAFQAYRAILDPAASLYVCHASSWQTDFQSGLEQSGFVIRCQIIWAKNHFAWGFGRYKYQHEPIFYCHGAGQQDRWYGDKSQSTLWEANKPAANRDHPTAKPVELIERAIRNSSRRGENVADLFAGSGATLIACQRLGRKSCLMEIDPQYSDVIVRRYQEFVGQGAVLEGDGRSFEEVARQRLLKAA
jgi:DNA modification methylase